MPTYEYRCKSCGEHLEVVQSFTDDPLTECPACGGPLRKVFGNIGIAFKGSGFYKTDSRTAAKSGSHSASGSGSESSSSDSGVEGRPTSASRSASPRRTPASRRSDSGEVVIRFRQVVVRVGPVLVRVGQGGCRLLTSALTRR